MHYGVVIAQLHSITPNEQLCEAATKLRYSQLLQNTKIFDAQTFFLLQKFQA